MLTINQSFFFFFFIRSWSWAAGVDQKDTRLSRWTDEDQVQTRPWISSTESSDQNTWTLDVREGLDLR